MKRLTLSLAATAAILACGAAAPVAQAQTSSSTASLSGLSWQLFDLDPADGIAPSLNFVASTDSWSNASSGMMTPAWDARSDFGSTAVDGPTYHAGTTASPALLESAASVAGTPEYPFYVSAQTSYALAFTLSPSTGVRFSVLAHAQAQHDDNGTSYSVATLTGKLDYPTSADWYRDTTVHDSLRADGQSLDATLFGYLEADALGRSGQLGLTTISTGVRYPAAPVPEPHTYLMLASGLLIVGALRRRRTDSSRA